MFQQRPLDDDRDRPTAPHFVRALVDRITGTTLLNVRDVEEAARAARVEEEAALQKARDAKAAREAAEREMPAARTRAKEAAAEITRQARARLQGVEQGLAEAQELEASDRARPSPQMRVRARMLRLAATESGSSEEPFSAAAALTSLATLDAVCGAWLNCSQTAGRTMQWLATVEGADPRLMAEADALECQGWSGVMRRIKHLAGES